MTHPIKKGLATAADEGRDNVFEMIAFDADDTLWHTETLYVTAQDELKEILARYTSPAHVERWLHDIEMRNLQFYGYGIKGFGLSLIEAAIELSQGRITGQDVQRIVDITKAMLSAEVRLVEHAEQVVSELARVYPLMLVTKGDLFDQERKIARSGLQPYFRYLEIVSDKTAERYAALLAKYQIEPSRFLMVGNSLRSDVLPVIALGGQAIHIPHELTWSHEHASPSDEERGRYHELEHISHLPGLIEQLGRNQKPSHTAA